MINIIDIEDVNEVEGTIKEVEINEEIILNRSSSQKTSGLKVFQKALNREEQQSTQSKKEKLQYSSKIL